MAEKSKESVIIYADLVAPRNDLLNRYVGTSAKYQFDGVTFGIDLASIVNPLAILVPAHAVMWPSKIYLSSAWLDFIELIQFKEITLITPPMQSRNGMVAESYLSALSASEIRLVK
jgi:hypothetical protein